MALNSDRIRKPGEEFELTDDELLAAPPRLLSRDQRRRRRQLKNNASKDRLRTRRAAAKNGEPPPPVTKIHYCQAETAKGLNCEGYAVMGAKHCSAHLTEEEREKLGVIREPGGRPKTVASPIKLAKEVVEVATTKALKPYLDAIGVELVGFDEENRPVVRYLGDDHGLMIHGESKDGDIVMTSYHDLTGRVQIMEKLFDRVYGRPKQTQVLEGGVQPIQIQPVRTVERAHAMTEIMRRSGMVGQEPALEQAPEQSPGVAKPVEGEVLPLRPDRKGD